MQSFIGNGQNMNSAVQKIGDTIDTVMEKIRPPLIQIPPILLLCDLLQRPGLSATILASELIAVMERIGIPTGVNPDGSENLIVKLAQEGSKVLVEHVQNYARVDGAVAPGAMSIQSTGVAGVIPVTANGQNINAVATQGSIR